MDALFLVLHCVEIYLLLKPRDKKPRKAYELTSTKLIDLNTGTPLSNIPEELETKFYQKVMAERNRDGFKLTEKFWWMDTDYWKSCGGTSVKTFSEMLAKSEREGVTKRQNPKAANSTRVIASEIKLRKKARGERI